MKHYPSVILSFLPSSWPPFMHHPHLDCCPFCGLPLPLQPQSLRHLVSSFLRRLCPGVFQTSCCGDHLREGGREGGRGEKLLFSALRHLAISLILVWREGEREGGKERRVGGAGVITVLPSNASSPLFSCEMNPTNSDRAILAPTPSPPPSLPPSRKASKTAPDAARVAWASCSRREGGREDSREGGREEVPASTQASSRAGAALPA